jgi:phosphatidylglycerophosphatase A
MISLRRLPATLHGTEPFYLLATWFHAGRIRPASGSWGALAAWPVCWLVKYFAGTLGLVVFGSAMYAAGIWAVKKYAPHAKNMDPAEVVIDEVVGMAIVFLFIPLHSVLFNVLGYIAFRLFDGIKRGPVGWCDRNIKGAHGVMIDDVVAGLFAGITILALHHLLF